MKKLLLIFLPAWVFFAGIMTACNNSANSVVDMIQIEGVSWACNVNTSYAIFGSSAESEDQLEVTLPASPGDLLYMIKDDLQFYYRYSSESDTLLSVSFDTLNAVSVYLNGNLEYMELSGTASIMAFNQLSGPEIKQLSTLYLEGPFSDDQLMMLKKHETSIAGKGLVVEGNARPERFLEVLSICQPEFLVINDLNNLPDPQGGNCVSNLELLWVDSNIPELARLVNCCHNLQSLIVANWEPEPGELLTLTGLKNLQSVTIAESELTSLSSVEFPASLRKLYLVSCDTLSDIKGLVDLQKLRRLSLTDCGMIQELDILMEMESLQWLSFPPGISQEEFGKLTERFARLEVAELIDCYGIKDLSPLQTLPDLRILVLQLEQDQLGMLDSLRQLKLLILSNEVFDDNPLLIKELRASLSDTKIVPGSGLCLGSGWLLLLLPLILIFRQFFRHNL